MKDLRPTRRVFVLAVALAVAVAMLAGTVSAASPTACKVKNVTRGGTHASLAAAVKKAKGKDRLSVRGSCVTGRTVITKRLTIYGVRNATSGPPTLRGTSWGPTLMLLGEADVTVKGLTIKGKNGVVLPQNRRGGGIYVGEDCGITLQNVTVKEFKGRGIGGGIATEGGTVRLLGTTRIQGNKAASGGGIWNDYGTITMRGKSVVRRNKGSGIFSLGPVTMKRQTAVHDNTGTGIAGNGPLVLSDGASVHHNSGDGITGFASVSLSGDASVHHNADGGIRNVGSVEVRGSASVRDNSGEIGAGIVEFQALTMSDDASVTGNASTCDGGGLRYRSSATLTGVVCAPDAGANVYGNTPDDCYGY